MVVLTGADAGFKAPLGSETGSAKRVEVTNQSNLDKELVVTTYQVKTAFTGASVGDTITSTRVIDLSGSNPVQSGSTIWRNESTDAVLTEAPLAARLNLTGQPGLTDAQLRAAPLPTTDDTRPSGKWFAITPHDTNVLATIPRAICNEGAPGSVTLVDADGGEAAFYFAQGQERALQPRRVKLTGITAGMLLRGLS